MRHVIRLPNGNRVSLATYVDSWRTLKTLAPDASVRGFDHFGMAAKDILRDLIGGMHDRINKHDPAYGKGRKWDAGWQIEMRRAARDLNHPRLAIHWLPTDLRGRFADRLREAV